MPTSGRGLIQRALLAVLVVVAGAALLFALTPWPSALVVRHVYTGSGENSQQLLGRFVPDDVTSRLDLAYGEDGDERLDVHRPADAAGRLPTIVWVHGGGWVGGDKEDVGPYLKILAAQGYTVVGLNYSLAPEDRYPTPTRQANQAVGWVLDHAAELGVDEDEVVLAGDSAGAQIAAQVATIATSSEYARAMGVRPALEPEALRGIVLDCGAFDPVAMMQSGHLGTMTVRSYLGGDTDEAGAQARTADHVTGEFPPTWISAGNADPLEPQSRELAGRLDDLGVDVATLFFSADHRPALGHEYQFNLAADEGKQALGETLAFLDEVT